MKILALTKPKQKVYKINPKCFEDSYQKIKTKKTQSYKLIYTKFWCK